MRLSQNMLDKLKVIHPLYVRPGDTTKQVYGIQSYVYYSPLNDQWRGYAGWYHTIDLAHESWIRHHYE